MGIGLTLLPLNGPRDIGETDVYDVTRLRFQQDYGIFSQLMDSEDRGWKATISTMSIPPQMRVHIHDGERVRKTREDAYGVELTFVYAKQMKKLKNPDNVSPRNKAIMAFIRALEDDVPIILLWD